VKLWERYFPSADLHFVDVTAENIRYNSSRSHYHFIEQTNGTQLKELGQRYGPFDVILDDGGHWSEQIIISFEALVEFVKPGIISFLLTTYFIWIIGSKDKISEFRILFFGL
jgi:demethylmacrocin O-methyltransferase